MKYKEIKEQSDIEELMYGFGSFHDSCLINAMIKTGYSVDESLSMVVPFGQHSSIKIIFQRQNKKFSTLDILFEQVIHFNFVPAQEKYDRIIHSAYFEKIEDIFYWADLMDWRLGEENSDICWIAAKKIKWRAIR